MLTHHNTGQLVNFSFEVFLFIPSPQRENGGLQPLEETG